MLLLTPTGRDAEMVRARLGAEGLACEACPDLDALLAGLASPFAGVAVVAQEALSEAGAARLLAALDAQEPWSDVPVLLLLSKPRWRQVAAEPTGALRILERANVTLLQRPLGVRTLASAVRSALRARRRQYRLHELHRELERAVELSDLFVSILGHDLRSPLAAIRLAAEGIVRRSEDARALRPAGRILTSAERMTRMIEQLLDLARVRQGRGFPLRAAPMDLGELCRQAIQEQADAHPDVEIRLRPAGDLTGTWDADRLAQVVTNLVGNAVVHGAKSAPIVVEADGTEPGLVRLRVENAGTIPPPALPTLFDAFKQSGPGARRQGLGLGLFIAREIVRAHGGELGVVSAGDRTTFEATLPREKSAAPAPG